VAYSGEGGRSATTANASKKNTGSGTAYDEIAIDWFRQLIIIFHHASPVSELN
jgi:hypothetical protein